MLSRTQYGRLEVELLKSLNQLRENKDFPPSAVLSSCDLWHILNYGQALLKKHNMSWHHARNKLAYFGDESSLPAMHLLFQYRLVELGSLLSEAMLDAVQQIVEAMTSKKNICSAEQFVITRLCQQIPKYTGQKAGQLRYTLELPAEPDTEALQYLSREQYACFQQRYRIDANALGNVSLTSDYDITIIIPEFPEHEIDVVIRFNDLFREKFKNHEASVVFDTNIYNAAFLSSQDTSGSDKETISYTANEYSQSDGPLLNISSEFSYSSDTVGIEYSFLSIRQCFAKHSNCAVVDYEQWSVFKGQVIDEVKTQITDNHAFRLSIESQGKSSEDVFALASKKIDTIFCKTDQLHQTIEAERRRTTERLAQAIKAAPGQLNAHQQMRVANDLYETELCKVKQLILEQKKHSRNGLSPGLSFNEDDSTLSSKTLFSPCDSNLRASFCVDKETNATNYAQAETQGDPDFIAQQMAMSTGLENEQNQTWVNAQCRALAFANEAYFSEGAVKNILKCSQKDGSRTSRYYLLQSLLMDIGYKIKKLRQGLSEKTPFHSSYAKINAITTAKYGVRVRRTCHYCHQLPNESLLFTNLYQTAFQKVQSVFDQEMVYQSIRDEYRSKPYGILSQNEPVLGAVKRYDTLFVNEMLKRFDPDKTFSDFIRLAAVLMPPFILTDYCDKLSHTH